MSESDYPDWNAFVAASPHGSIYGTADYMQVLSEATGGRFRILGATKGDELVGGVALHEHAGHRGPRIAPRPLLYYNGVVLREFATRYPSQKTARTLEVTAALEAAISACGYEAVALKHPSSFIDARSFMDRGWTVRPGYSYRVAIGDLELAWGRMEQNLRRLVNRCSQEGMQVVEDSDFDSFLRMHFETTARKGLTPYLPADRFVRFFEKLRALDLCRLYHARLPSGQSVSAQLVLTGRHPVSHSVCAATDPAYLHSGATAFLRWKVFEALSAMGFASNDLTDAALNAVTHFKSQLGGSLELCLICEKALVQSRRWPGRVRAKLETLFKG